MTELTTSAGSGEHKAYLVVHDDADGDELPLTAQEHYIGIDAVSWFVNKEASWFRDRMAVGTLSIMLAGDERYEVGLGTYELKAGATTAPIFGRPVLPERVFRGGTITFRVVLSGLARDTRLARLIKSTSIAALSVVGGLVQTAALSGPSAPLSTAAGTLVGGIREILDEQEEKMRIFDASGFEITLRPIQLVGKETYVLLHRGAPLDRAKLAVSRNEAVPSLTYDNQLLRDGAWVLLRLRRESQYPIERDWFQLFRRWLNSVDSLVDDVQNGVVSKEEALNTLRPGLEAAPTVYDRYRNLRDQILNDGVLTQTEAAGYSLTLSKYRRLAATAISTGNDLIFRGGVQALCDGIAEGQAPDSSSLRDLQAELRLAGDRRPAPLKPNDFESTGLARLTAESDPFEILQGLPRLVDAASRYGRDEDGASPQG
jgi:hypothetical protein